MININDNNRGVDCPSPEGVECRGFKNPRLCVLAGCGRPGPGDPPQPSVKEYFRNDLAGIPYQSSTSVKDTSIDLPMPSTWKSIKNFGSAVMRNMKTGFIKIDDSIKKQRLDSCESCPLFVRQSRRCSQCACFVDVKVTFGREACPVGRWPGFKDDEEYYLNQEPRPELVEIVNDMAKCAVCPGDQTSIL